MRYSLASAVFGVAALVAGAAAGQTYPPLFSIAPAPPEMFPTWSRHDELSGTTRHNIAATPGCGAANPQGGIPSMVTGTCP